MRSPKSLLHSGGCPCCPCPVHSSRRLGMAPVCGSRFSACLSPSPLELSSPPQLIFLFPSSFSCFTFSLNSSWLCAAWPDLAAGCISLAASSASSTKILVFILIFTELVVKIDAAGAEQSGCRVRSWSCHGERALGNRERREQSLVLAALRARCHPWAGTKTLRV